VVALSVGLVGMVVALVTTRWVRRNPLSPGEVGR
jgi:hypothetical protein